MFEADTLVGIYNYKTGETSSFYYIMYFFDANGMVDHDFLSKIYSEISAEAKNIFSVNSVGPFENLPTLNHYASMVCEKMNTSRVCLVSIQDYNSILKNVSSMQELRTHLLEKGNCIENLEKNKKKGILGKIFN